MSWTFTPAYAAPEDDEYDPRCEDVATAIKALWRCYAKHKDNRGWYMLEEMGLRRSTYEPYFERFDFLYITTDHGLLHTHSQIVQFLRFLPETHRLEVIGAALYMCGLYMSIMKEKRKVFIRNQKEAQQA